MAKGGFFPLQVPASPGVDPDLVDRKRKRKKKLSQTQELIKVTQEKLPDSQVGLEIEVPSTLTQQSYEQVIRDYMRSANIPGFRKGKVPRQVVIQRLGTERIKAAAIEDLVQSLITKAVEQEKIEAIGNYQLRSSFEVLIDHFQPGQALTFSASVDVPPAMKLGQYTDLQVKAVETQYDPQQVESVLEAQQSERATLVPIEDRPAQMGDVVLVDFSGRRMPAADTDTEAELEIPGAQATDFQLELDEGRFIEGFVEAIVGMKPEETKEVSLTFPEEYPQEELAGQPVVFTISLKEIKEKELPTLDDDFAQEISEFESLAELRNFLEDRYQKEAKEATDASIEAALLEEILKEVEAEIPETLVKNEVNYLLTQTANRLQSQGMDIKQLFTAETLPAMQERVRPEAVTRLERTLALAEIAKQESVQVEAAEVEERVQSILEQYRDRQVDPEQLKQVVEEELLHEKVIEWLKEHSQIELVSEAEMAESASAETESMTETAEASLQEPAEEPETSP